MPELDTNGDLCCGGEFPQKPCGGEEPKGPRELLRLKGDPGEQGAPGESIIVVYHSGAALP